MLHFIALHYIALHHIALHHIALHYIALHYIALHCIALPTQFHVVAVDGRHSILHNLRIEFSQLDPKPPGNYIEFIFSHFVFCLAIYIFFN